MHLKVCFSNEDFFDFISIIYIEQFKYTVLENENTEEDADEEEETDNEDEEGEEEGEEEEVDLFKRDKKKHLGDTSIYDPVALYDKGVLLPGKPDFFASYNSKTYRFANDENRSAFLQTPLKYVPINKPPKVISFIEIDHILISFF
jgi:YHS domain-containing protein